MKIWQPELLQVLEQFEIVAVGPLQRPIPAIPLIYQTISLSLYLPLGILETFSGKDGEKQSSDVYQSSIQRISAVIICDKRAGMPARCCASQDLCLLSHPLTFVLLAFTFLRLYYGPWAPFCRRIVPLQMPDVTKIKPSFSWMATVTALHYVDLHYLGREPRLSRLLMDMYR
jgi:hypothetical protein